MQIAILGRQPSISLAELESIFGAKNINKVLNNIAVVNTLSPLPQDRLGGTIKSGQIITTLKNKKLDDAYEYIYNNVTELTDKYTPEGKIQFGVSIYGIRYPKKSIFKNNLEIKKILKKHGRSVRIIENKTEALETAQVLHNKLTSNNGLEVLIIASASDIIIAKATGIQNIEKYTKRDRNRPMRDAKVGMLPPKLAQIIINLTNPQPESLVMDPFCGTGVLLQEASLMGFSVIGTDIQKRMIDYTHGNLTWLSSDKNSTLHNKSPEEIMEILSVGDATSFSWQDMLKREASSRSYGIACETYLGKPLSTLPSSKVLDHIVAECDQIHRGFLANIGKQIKSGTRLCLAVPAWRKPNGFIHLKTLDYLGDLGYTRISFAHVANRELIYHRTDQVVARELVVLEKT